jgi:hypothetical protein
VKHQNNREIDRNSAWSPGVRLPAVGLVSKRCSKYSMEPFTHAPMWRPQSPLYRKAVVKSGSPHMDAWAINLEALSGQHSRIKRSKITKTLQQTLKLPTNEKLARFFFHDAVAVGKSKYTAISTSRRLLL